MKFFTELCSFRIWQSAQISVGQLGNQKQDFFRPKALKFASYQLVCHIWFLIEVYDFIRSEMDKSSQQTFYPVNIAFIHKMQIFVQSPAFQHLGSWKYKSLIPVISISAADYSFIIIK